jgi:hypothetical protein
MKKKTITRKKPQSRKRTASRKPNQFRFCMDAECSVSAICTRKNIEEYLERMAWI